MNVWDCLEEILPRKLGRFGDIFSLWWLCTGGKTVWAKSLPLSH